MSKFKKRGEQSGYSSRYVRQQREYRWQGDLFWPFVRKSPSDGEQTQPEKGTVYRGEIERFGTWVLDENGLLTIGGKDKMPDWDKTTGSRAPWHLLNDSIQSVQLAAGITSIGNEAFYSCSNLKSITIPDSVTSIGDEAFSGCSSLESVTIPDSVRNIGIGVFKGCDSLQEVIMPARLKRMAGKKAWLFSERLSGYFGIEKRFIRFY